MNSDLALRSRGIRTLAWLGDGEFEREVRLRLVRRGDYTADRLDKLRARIVNSRAQAELLGELRDRLDDAEQAVVRRARNAAPNGSGRGSGSVREYRAATALEALIAWWLLGGLHDRFDELIAPAIESRIDGLLDNSGRDPDREDNSGRDPAREDNSGRDPDREDNSGRDPDREDK